MIIFTFDIDWAPEPLIQDVVDLLNEYGIEGTFFATHKSETLNRLETAGKHEIAIHPNFNKLLAGQGGTFQETIDDLLEIYPTAVGLRSHSLTHSCPILLYALEKGIKYDSNIYIPFAKDLPVFDYFGLMRIPYNWEDDGQWVSGKSFDNSGLSLAAALNVFSFHPIHIYLNTANQEMYDRIKQFYQFPDELLKNRNKVITGTRDLFISLLKECKKNNHSTCTMGEFYRKQNFKSQNQG